MKKNLFGIIFLAIIIYFITPISLQADILDLTTSGSYGKINNAWFYETGIAPTGTGNIDSFLKFQNQPNEGDYYAYNTSYRPLPSDNPYANNALNFTHDLLLSDIPIVKIENIDYREFLLDINQKNIDPILYLTVLEIYISQNTQPNSYSTLGTKIWELGSGNQIKLNYNLNAGSGQGDMFAYIPDSLFIGGNYVYLYSKFSENNDGFEEWAVKKVTPVPEPGILLLIGIGLTAVGIGTRWMRRKKG